MFFSFLWNEKYIPTKSSEFIGNNENIEKLKTIINNIKQNSDNLVCLYGNIHTGKKLASKIVLNELNYTYNLIDYSEFKTENKFFEAINEISTTNIVNIFNNTKNSIIIDNFIPKKNRIKFLENYASTHKNTPIILIYQNYKNLNLFQDICKLHFTYITSSEMISILKNICIHEKLNITTQYLQILVQNSENNLQRLLMILENIKVYWNNKTITEEDLLTQLNVFQSIDIDIDQYKVYHDCHTIELSIEQSINSHEKDSNIYLLLQENFYNNIINSKIPESKLLEILIKYYDKLVNLSILEKEFFSKQYWFLNEYIAVLGIKVPNLLIKENQLITKINTNNITILSKMNYHFCNLKHINNICKILKLSYSNFQYFTILLYENYIFNDLDTRIPDISFYIFDKCIKLSYLFTKYDKLYTKKKQTKYKKIFS